MGMGMILILLIMLLLSVAFLTLFERKILSLSQLRIGPNKIGLYGLIQPILDGVKLMKKSSFLNFNSHELVYKLMSIMIIFFSLMFWIAVPYQCWSNKILVPMFIILMFGVLSYMILMLGWGSMSNYGLIGGNRSLAQVLSFEMMISLLIFLVFILKMKMSMKMNQVNSFWLTSIISLVFTISIFLETHRAPMDLAEGESELVSGYNVEYGSIFFIMIFLSEYSSILFLSVLYFMLWCKMSLLLLMFMLLIMIIRSCFPRIRYDQIMCSIWMKFMPFLILMWFFLINLKL